MSDGSWALFEVKSGSRVKDHYHDDIAVQVHVLREAGVALQTASILHLNTDYILRAPGIELRELFKPVNLLPEIDRRLDGLEHRLVEQFECLSSAPAPQVEPGDHCHSPITCEYWETCTETKPVDWLFRLPHLRAK
jgi:hypothetical protein